MAAENHLIIHFLDVTFDDLGNKIETEKICNIKESDFTIADIVSAGGYLCTNDNCTWFPYHQIFKIVKSCKSE